MLGIEIRPKFEYFLNLNWYIACMNYNVLYEMITQIEYV